ncbi:MAG: dihydrolipoyllysine-residue acetyltransferase [Ignavibacteria bacterium]|nr:dihydrolipoyllysine-residue acetyltransferase [Ignavibacteria bacterium]MBT8381598.1 dihydrolipoyllysine-residue acetyltransferase [Ignavibacteria bacterium]MBT8391989.1 dihydrolipoyllysine-residue acetyltransferase [Ignavibacteria bacterium]NNJ53151.1 dihydrolipoyllysine-residue acetyltransferase [Ignavibacteriaceae bacterium]NNL21050.1 dihydrolipoyllysine-residue acetyltransferase [Ignavibacteriaceae bacterium]
MAKEFKLPDLGENIESAEVVSVLIKVGDTVKKEQSIIEIETDKATIEVPSNIAGKISEVLVNEGDSVKVGQTIINVDEDGKSDEKEEAKAEAKEGKKTDGKGEREEEELSPKKEEAQSGVSEVLDFKVPDLGESIESADVINVLVKKGDSISKDESVIEIETDKATVEVPSSVEGKIVELNVKIGDKVKMGDVLLKVESSKGAVPSKEDKEKPVEKYEEQKQEDEQKEKFEEEEQSTAEKGEVEEMKPGECDDQPPILKASAPAAPSVRRIARELGVDINAVRGTGPGGRISMNDVKAHVKKLMQKPAEGFGFGIKKEALPDFSKYGKIERESMSKIREKTATHLSYAWAVTPHVTQFDQTDITEFEKDRKELSKRIEEHGAKLTVTGILIKIISEGLKKFPQFNSSIDMEKKEIIYKKYINIGVAVDTEYGLLVPVIKNVDEKNLIDISVELNSLAEKARNKKLSLEEMQGGCFTITNLGGIGGTYFTPIVNSPEVAIMGISRANYKPVYDKEGSFEPRLMLPLSISYDHRIIDGADAIRFLRWVCEALEEPLKIFM